MFFAKTHEWVRESEADVYLMGISDHAQSELSDIVFVDLPELGQHVKSGDQMLAIDSVKAASDIYAPLSGEIVEVNEKLQEEPELINTSPETEAWIVKIKISDPNELHQLLSPEEYKKSLGGDE